MPSFTSIYGTAVTPEKNAIVVYTQTTRKNAESVKAILLKAHQDPDASIRLDNIIIINILDLRTCPRYMKKNVMRIVKLSCKKNCEERNSTGVAAFFVADWKGHIAQGLFTNKDRIDIMITRNGDIFGTIDSKSSFAMRRYLTVLRNHTSLVKNV
tara:strand:+ start:21429 stop:21893 length:465 start_codon:yes stop_codon:yes gene_type:complete